MSARIPVSEAHGQQKKRKPQTTSWSPLCAAEKQSCSGKKRKNCNLLYVQAKVGILFHICKNIREELSLFNIFTRYYTDICYW